MTTPNSEKGRRRWDRAAIVRRLRLTTAAIIIVAVLGTTGIGAAVADEIPGTTTSNVVVATRTGMKTGSTTTASTTGSTTTTTVPTRTTKSATTTSGATG